jgi:hypothetical protein
LRVGVEPQDDLRLALGDEAGEPVGEARTGLGLLVSGRGGGR